MLEASKSGILYLLCWRKLLITDTAPGWPDKQSPGKFTVITSLPVSRGEKRVRQDLNIWVISGLSLTPPAWVDQVGWCNSNTNPGTCGLSDWFKNSSLSALTLTMFLYDTLNHFTEVTTQKRENFNYVAEIFQDRFINTSVSERVDGRNMCGVFLWCEGLSGEAGQVRWVGGVRIMESPVRACLPCWDNGSQLAANNILIFRSLLGEIL